MSIINKEIKHNKYEADWETNVKRLANVLAETEKNKLPTLLTEAKQLNTEQEKVKQEIKKLETEESDLGDIVGRQQRVNEQLDDLKTNYNTIRTKVKSSFLGNATSKYDWETKIKTYYPTTYSDNLYEGMVNGSKVKITEQEAIKLITRVIKAFEKIDETKFGTKFTASSHTTGTNNLPMIRKLAKDGLKSNEIIGKDSNGLDLSDKGKPANHKHLNQVEYSFKSQFIADADIAKTPSAAAFIRQSTETITKVKVDDFFSFINNISKDGTINPDFLTELKADADILKDIENNIIWKIVPAEKTALEPTKLAVFGIKVANDNNTKLYLSEKYDKAVKFSISEGLKSWIELVHAFFPNGSSQQNKLSNSFTADPYEQLLTDISSNAHSAHWELPESKDDLQEIANQIELKKISAAGRITRIGEKIQEKKEELTTKTDELTNKETELNTLLTKIITKKREELNKSNIKEFENKTDSGGEDNRKTQDELYTLITLLYEIRYLENDGDASLDSSVADENTALTTAEGIFSKCFGLWHQSSWDSIGWKSGASELENRQITNQQKIAIIKENKDNEFIFGVNYFYDQLVELEKLVKLNKQQQQVKADLKAAIENKSPEENLQEWRDILKTIDTGLGTVFTDEKINKWKEKKDDKEVFNNTSSIKSLLEKIVIKKADGTVDKVAEDFLTFIKGKDSTLDTLSKLIEKKDPADVILYIHQREFNKLTDEKKKERYLKFAWSELGGKQKIDSKENLEDSEKDNFDKFLYQVAIGKIVESSLTKPAEENGDNPNSPTPKNNGDKKQMSALKEWLGFGSVGKSLLSYGGILVVVIGILATIFWDKIKKWWGDPEEQIPESEEEEKSEPFKENDN